MYFVSFNLGLLKGNPVYGYPYFLRNIIKEGQVCIDIGANLGYLSVLFAKLVGPTGKVYAVEPVAPVRKVLLANTKQYRQVEILPYALGESNAPIQLGNNTVDKQGFMASGSHFVLPQTEASDVTFDAEMRIGSELFQDLTRLDFIKCDVEGYEIVVIPELRPIIEKFEPIILVELGKSTREKLTQFFASLNYNSFVLNGQKLVKATGNETCDVLFVPPAKMNAVAGHMK